MVVLNHNCPDEHLSLEDRGTDMAAALRPSIQFLAVLSMSLLLCGFSEEAERVWKGGSGRASLLAVPHPSCSDYPSTECESLEQETQFAWLCCSALPMTFPTLI